MSGSVEVQYLGNMAEVTGKRQEVMRADSVDDILSYIEEQYGKAVLKEAKRMIIAVNGTDIRLLARCKTGLAHGDRVEPKPHGISLLAPKVHAAHVGYGL